MIRDLRHYCLIPITPIHIGDGSELDPMQYLIKGQRLERFDPVATIAALSEVDRRNYIRALGEGELPRGTEDPIRRCIARRDSDGLAALGSLRQRIAAGIGEPEPPRQL